jgi:hypothetical protein
MKQYLFSTLVFFLFFVNGTFCQTGQSSQTLHEVYAIEAELTQLVLDLSDGKVEIRNTNASRISVETVVMVSGLSNEKMLNFLVEQGRYTLKMEKDLTSGTVRISNNKNRNVLMIKGQQCQEDFTYIVYVPSSIKTVQNKSAASPSAQVPAPQK